MGSARQSLSTALCIVVIAGLLCSQVCALNCVFNGCPVSFSVPLQSGSNENGHCSRHQKDPSPPKQNDSHRCPGHFDAVVIPPSANIAATVKDTPDTLAATT